MGGASGQLLAGRYQLLGKIGQGGMGVVWRAFDIGLDREVAVKELRLPEWVDEGERPRWYARMGREARAAARLKHPGIVTVYDRVLGEDGRPWIVMELVHGTSLADEVKRHGRLPVRRAAAIGLRLLDAVSAAHAHGIVHRDIKPANVLLEGDRVVLTDFGIAALEGDVTLTHTGSVLGTPAYMSPEQIHGQPVPESDLWSLGATLYNAVEGRPPFTGPTNGAVFAAIAAQDPVPPSHAGPLVPVLSGLLRKAPAERLTAEATRDLLAPIAHSRSAEQKGAAHGPASFGKAPSGPAVDRSARPAGVEPERDGHITPLVRKIATEQRVDLGSIRGTGANGRIREQDVIAAARKRHGAYATAAAREFAAEHGVDLANVQGTGPNGLILVQDAMRPLHRKPKDGDVLPVSVIALVVIGALVLLFVLTH